MSKIIQIGKMFNCYLIVGSKGSILVDTGPISLRAVVYEKVKEQNLQLIVLTHGHIDHIANAAYLSDKLNIPIAMHQSDYELIRNQLARTVVADNIIGKMIQWMSDRMIRKSPVEPFEPYIYLEQGMSLMQYGVSGEICELPGHTKGSIGIIVDGDKLIAGDSMMNMVGSPASKLFEDKEMMLCSMKKIQKMPVSKIFVGHGKMIKQ